MKNTLPFSLYFFSFFLILTFFISTNCYSVVNVYPSPGVLSGVSHLVQSSNYTVTVNGLNSFVYETDNYWIGADGLGSKRRVSTKAAFTNFESDQVTENITVTCNYAIKSVTIRPKSDSVKYTISGKTISFAMKAGLQLSIEVNDRTRPLFIFSNPIETPEVSAKHYFGPGVHFIGNKYPIMSNEHVYIAGGAVVEGTFNMLGSNIQIAGRGILTSGHLSRETHWVPDHTLSPLTDTVGKNQTLSGITIVNSPGWIHNGYGKYDSYTNMKFISWVGNTDLPHLNGNSTMTHCFGFTNDDILISNMGNDNTYSDCVIWSGPWGRPIVTLSDNSHNSCSWNNIDIIGNESVEGSKGKYIAFIEGSASEKSYFTFKDIRIESPVSQGLIGMTGVKSITNIVFENINMEQFPTVAGIISNDVPGGVIDNLTFKGCKVAGVNTKCLSELNILPSGTIGTITFDNSAYLTSNQEVVFPDKSVLELNRANKRLNISLENDELKEVTVFDGNGHLIITQNSTTINLSTWGNGLYFVRIIGSKKIYSEKFMY